MLSVFAAKLVKSAAHNKNKLLKKFESRNTKNFHRYISDAIYKCGVVFIRYDIEFRYISFSNSKQPSKSCRPSAGNLVQLTVMSKSLDANWLAISKYRP